MALTPSQGAPASGPGRMSQRTDLSPAGQPTRVPTGGQYGAAKASRQQQGAAPMQAQAPPGMREGAFGPTQRPGEPITAGAATGPGPGPASSPPQQDPDLMLRALYQLTGHPDLERMLLRRRMVR